MSSANYTRVSKALVDTTSLVYTENNIGERTPPCGAPVFTISSSDLVPLRLPLCGRSHRNCLIQRTRVWLAPRSKSLLIRRWGWIVLKADEKSMSITRTYDPDLSRWLAVRFTRIRHASSAPFWPCRQTVHAIGHRSNQLVTHYPLHTLCQNRCQSHRPGIIHLFYIGFLWNWYYNWALRAWNRHAIQKQLKQTGKHWSQLWCAHLEYSTFEAIRTWGLGGVKSRKTWNHISLFHVHRTWEQWATDIVTLTAEVSDIKSGIKPVQLICKTTWTVCFDSLLLIFPTHHCIQPPPCIFCITHFEFFLHFVFVCRFG